MPQFRRFTTAELIAYVRAFNFIRAISQWHIHHTWLPDYNSFNGSNHDALQQGMKDYHIDTNGWSDIGQNLTLFPDGTWLLGRDFNVTPASILGWNAGALAVEMLGNFDVGGDMMTYEQQQAIYEVSEFLAEEMGLQVRFHRDSPTSYKTCPGSGIDRDTFFNEFLNFTENKILREQQAQAELEAQLAEQERQRVEVERQAALEAARKKAEELRRLMEEVKTVFTDMVREDGTAHWANGYVMNLYNKRIISGIQNDDGSLRYEPDAPITRAEAATLICKAYESLEEKMNKLLTAIDNIK